MNITHLKNLIDLATCTSDFWIARTMVIDSDIPPVIKADFLRQITEKRLGKAVTRLGNLPRKTKPLPASRSCTSWGNSHR